MTTWNTVAAPTDSEEVTNILRYSEDFTQGAYWTPSNVAVFENSVTAPDGKLTATTLRNDLAGGNGGGIFQSTGFFVFTTSGEKVVSIFLQQGTSSVNRLQFGKGSNSSLRHQILVTWTAGVPALTTGSGTGTLFTPVEDEGDFYRIAFTYDAVVAGDVQTFVIQPSNGGVIGETVVAWGAQAEDAATAGVYTPTAGGAVTQDLTWLRVRPPFPE